MKHISLPPLDDNGNPLFDDWTEPIIVEDDNLLPQEALDAIFGGQEL